MSEQGPNPEHGVEPVDVPGHSVNEEVDREIKELEALEAAIPTVDDMTPPDDSPILPIELEEVRSRSDAVRYLRQKAAEQWEEILVRAEQRRRER